MKPFLMLIAVLLASPLHAATENPLVFPDGQPVAASAPLFFWQDLSGEKPGVFRVSIDGGNGMSPLFEATPQNYNGFFYLVSPKPLAAGSYSYELAPLYSGKPDTTKYFGYRKYPIRGSFSASTSAQPSVPEETIDWLNGIETNTRDNGLNALFFGGGAIVCAGVSALFFTALDFNIWTRIAAYSFAAGAVTGAGASAAYGYRHISTKHELEDRYRAVRERGIHLSFSSRL